MAKKKAPAKKKNAAGAPVSGVLVVNMIPKSLSGEANQDSEPMLAVNPAKPTELVGTAFTPNPFGGTVAPVYVSTDGGNTWVLNANVPSGGVATGDITVAFSKKRNLYSGILRADNSNLNVLRTSSFTTATPMTVLNNRPNNDQPFTAATTVPAGADKGKDRVYVGNNDFQASPKTASVDVYLNGAVSTNFKSIRLEKRPTLGQNGPQIRPAVHDDGTVYAVFYGWRSSTGSFPANTLRVTADVVVVRDDKWGNSAPPFEALKDPGDHLAGLRLAKGIRFGFNRNGSTANGQQRLGGTLSVAVDPTNSSVVYVAWGDEPQSGSFNIHVQRSANRGATWSADLVTLPRATNGALAVNSQGVVGLLFQQLQGTGASQRWVTQFQRFSNQGVPGAKLVLANTPALIPAKLFDPYIGDYDHVLAVNADFYGIFSANNTPDLANFPSGVVYQRNTNFTTKTLLNVNNVTPVQPSIDPFFFKIKG